MGPVDLCTVCKHTELEVSTPSMVLLESRKLVPWRLLPSFYYLFDYLLVCLFICMYGYPWRPEEGGRFLELEFQVTVSCHLGY